MSLAADVHVTQLVNEHKGIHVMGLEPTGYGPARLAAILKDDTERWGPPIRASGFKGD